MSSMCRVAEIYFLQELAPTEKIPDDFYELGLDQEVLKHECPSHLKQLKDDEVYEYILTC